MRSTLGRLEMDFSRTSDPSLRRLVHLNGVMLPPDRLRMFAIQPVSDRTEAGRFGIHFGAHLLSR